MVMFAAPGANCMLKKAKHFVRSLLDKAASRRRVAKLRANTPTITKAELEAALERLGIKKGDILMLHSSLKSLGYVDGGAKAVIDALIGAVGPAGTVVIPTYWQPGGTILGTCKIPGYLFDPRRDGTNLGRLPSEFLRYPGVERSIHPTHSVSAFGPAARYVTEYHHLAPSVFGHGSPWQRCHELNARILGLGVSMGPITIYHMLEDMLLDDFPLPVRMQQTWNLPCKDWNGNSLTVPVVPLDPAFMHRRIDSPGRDDLRKYFWTEFTLAGLLRSARIGQAIGWFIPAQDFYSHLEKLVAEGITIYSTPDQLEGRPLAGFP